MNSTNVNSQSNAELYDPATNTWTVAASMNNARQGATATLLNNGQVLVAGGNIASMTLSSTELYDPTTNTWTVTASMNQGRSFLGATLLNNGRVFVAGGFSSNGGHVFPAELYDPTTNTSIAPRA